MNIPRVIVTLCVNYMDEEIDACQMSGPLPGTAALTDGCEELARKPVNPVASLRQVVLKDWAMAAVAGPGCLVRCLWLPWLCIQ